MSLYEPATAPAASAAAEAHPPQPQQPHHMLHRHALESIFGGLAFRDLHSCLLVSRGWLSASCSMRGIGAQVMVYREEKLTAVLQSRLVRHIGDMNVHFCVSPAQISSICRCLPFLHSLELRGLDVDPYDPDVDWSQVAFAPSLRKLVVQHFTSDRGPVIRAAQAVFDAMSAQASITSLLFYLPMPLVSANDSGLEALSFAPLQTMDSLHSLTLHIVGVSSAFSGEPLWTEEQLGQLRGLTNLRNMHVRLARPSTSRTGALKAFLSLAGSPLHWRSIAGCLMEQDAVDDMVATMLLRVLPFLEAVKIQAAFLRSAAFLAALPCIRELCISGRNRFWFDMPTYSEEQQEEQGSISSAGAANGSSALENLLATLPSELSRVTSLALDDCAVDAAQLEGILRRFPKLEKLSLRVVRHWVDLSFLEPVRLTLTTLHMEDCENYLLCDDEERPSGPIVAYMQTHLPALTDLDLYNAGIVLEDEEEKALRLPSTLIPTLSKFRYNAYGCM